MAVTSGLSTENKTTFSVYSPNWSVKEKKGSINFYSLAPYIKIKDKNGKTPLILVHGVISEFKPYSNWQFLIEELEKDTNKKFFETHPIYIYRYPTSNEHWEESANALQSGIQELLSDYPKGSKVKIIASSLGGPVLCDAVNDDKLIIDRIQKVISLSSPFWGTPLLNENLSVNEHSTFGGMNSLLFDSTNLLFPDLGKNVHWKLPITSNESFDKDSHSYCRRLKSKTINYSGFIFSPANNIKNTSPEEMNQWLMNGIKSANYKKVWNIAMHYKLAWDMKESFGDINYLFAFNDGLVPIYSALWLDPEQCQLSNDVKQLNEDVLQQIKSNNPKARIFEGITHSEFTDKDLQENKKYKDLLNKNSSGSIAEIIIQDLK